MPTRVPRRCAEQTIFFFFSISSITNNVLQDRNFIAANFIWNFLHAQAEEEARSLQKKIQTIENELDQTQEALMQVNTKLEEKDKALQNVSKDHPDFSFQLQLYQFSCKEK